jgi:hypothetical protein
MGVRSSRAGRSGARGGWDCESLCKGGNYLTDATGNDGTYLFFFFFSYAEYDENTITVLLQRHFTILESNCLFGTLFGRKQALLVHKISTKRARWWGGKCLICFGASEEIVGLEPGIFICLCTTGMERRLVADSGTATGCA